MHSAPATEPPAPAALVPAPQPEPHPAGRRGPWRSAALGWLALAVGLAAGLPLFLRMPLWCDITLYDVAARNILRGGVHYRDVFDTNPPGFVWALCGVRAALGPSSEVLRAVDLLVVGAVAVLLLRWARAAGATPAGVAWTAAGVAGFYLFVSEFNHCQRDVWMMLPAVAAAWYRVRRVSRFREGGATDGWVFRTALAEGLVWGLAAWVKPHIILVAGACWAVTAGRCAGSGPAETAEGRLLRRPLVDLTGSVAGGLLVGAAGVVWLVASGTWPHFYDVFTNWNTAYLRHVYWEFEDRLEMQLGYFPPWSLLFVAAVPLAVLNLVDARVWAPDRGGAGARGPLGRLLPTWLYDGPTDPGVRFTRAVLAALYLGWAVTALVVQKQYHYVHVPDTLLMLALFAANRWAVAFPVLLLQAGVMLWLAVSPAGPPPKWEDQPVVARHVVWQYPNHDPDRFRWWPGCFARQVPPDLRDGVAFQSDMFAMADWSELEEVAAFLRAEGVRDGELMCWHDSPHALYLVLDVRPPIRFMHLSTVTGLVGERYDDVKREVTDAAPRVRFVVSDLKRVALFFPPEAKARMGEPGPDLLPPVLPAKSRWVFPMNQPAVFRSGGGRGRYVVHRVTNPVTEVYVPGWPEPEE